MIQNAKLIGSGVSYETYSRQDPEAPRGHRKYIMSRGELMEFAHCPARWLKGYKGEDTKATDWGSLIDCLVLTPKEFEKRYAVSPATFEDETNKCPTCGGLADSKKCKKCGDVRVPVKVQKPWNNQTTTCKEWNAEREKEGKIVVKATEKAEADAALAALAKDEQASSIIESSDTQVMVIGEYHIEGITIPLRCLIDLLPYPTSIFNQSLADFKTARGANLDFWAKQIDDNDYDAQAALELDLYNAACPKDPRIEFRHVIQENYAPWQTGRRILTEENLVIGRGKYQSALQRYAECLQTGSWPDYETGLGKDGWSYQPPSARAINRLTM